MTPVHIGILGIVVLFLLLASSMPVAFVMGLIGFIVGLYGYFIKLSSLGASAFFFTTNPFLFIILRTDKIENQMMFETIFPGTAEGLVLLLNGIFILVLSSLLWLIFNRRIQQIKYMH